jgi:hypothetical protein
MTKLYACALGLALVSLTAQAERFSLPGDMKLDVNGYIGYKYISSSVKNSAIKSSPELGLLLSLQATENLSFYTQLAYDQRMDTSLVYSFAAFDWQFENGLRTSIKAGKLRQNYALYNTTRINPRTRQGVIPPQAIYWDSLSTLLTSGIGVSGQVDYSNFEVGFTVDKPISIDPKQEADTWTTGLVDKVQVGFGSRKSAYLQYSNDEVPIKAKLSWFQLNLGNNYTLPMKYLFPEYLNKDQIVNIYLAGIEYSPTDKLTFIGETLFIKAFFNTLSHVEKWSNGYSFTAKYDLTEYTTPYINYNYYHSQHVDRTPPIPWQYEHTSDINAGINYHHDNWQVGIEAHYIQGGRWTMPNDFNSNPAAYKDWTMVGVNFAYFF